MGKSVSNTVLDGAVGYFESNCDKMTLCSAEPTTYEEANATYALADVALDADDFAVDDGDGGGRKVTVSAQDAVEVDATGTATHIALLDTGESALLLVTTMTERAMVDGDTANVPAFDFEIGDPS